MINLENISADQFFQPEHFRTFEGNKIHRNTPDILEERSIVQQRLLELDDQLFPEIQQRRWPIHRHNSPEHYVSGIDIENPFIPNQLRSIWLHYGKHPDEISQYQSLASDRSTQTFIHHERLQVIVYNHQENGVNDYGVGTWLVIGKNDGSTWDRENFRNSMRVENYRKGFFDLISGLNDEYFVSCNSNLRGVRSFSNENSLADFTHETNFHDYFIIGRAFEPTDPELSNDNIIQTVITEFEKLLPLYNYTKHGMS